MSGPASSGIVVPSAVSFVATPSAALVPFGSLLLPLPLPSPTFPPAPFPSLPSFSLPPPLPRACRILLKLVAPKLAY